MDVTLVVVEHAEAQCPLRQAGPDRATALAANLDTAGLTGFFQQKEHKGGAILPRTDHEGLRATVAGLLPHHLAPEFKDVTVEPDSLIGQAVVAAGLLDDAQSNPEAFERLRALAREFDRFFPERGLLVAETEAHPTISLRDLPGYLRDNAPQAA